MFLLLTTNKNIHRPPILSRRQSQHMTVELFTRRLVLNASIIISAPPDEGLVFSALGVSSNNHMVDRRVTNILWQME